MPTEDRHYSTDELLKRVKELQEDGLPVTVADAWRTKRPGGPGDTVEVRIDCEVCGLHDWVALREFGDREFMCPCGSELPLDQRQEIGFDLVRMILGLPLVRTRRVNPDETK